jgi:hypothetical protein
MPLVHTDTEFVNIEVGAAIRFCKEIGAISDANVAAANTVALLRSTLDTNLSAATLHGELTVPKTTILRAIDVGKETGAFTDALLNPLTTVDGLIALTGNTNADHRSVFSA